MARCTTSVLNTIHDSLEDSSTAMKAAPAILFLDKNVQGKQDQILGRIVGSTDFLTMRLDDCVKLFSSRRDDDRPGPTREESGQEDGGNLGFPRRMLDIEESAAETVAMRHNHAHGLVIRNLERGRETLEDYQRRHVGHESSNLVALLIRRFKKRFDLKREQFADSFGAMIDVFMSGRSLEVDRLGRVVGTI
ncbi:hypothetical protein K402DRAFT_19331 [Aulographum hederae CBS 113979]|uniref:Uncharacterized protein n=1 Tax=Aulographum hederae CBS 113979 TaxID=1176131 RepID=A0A6G1H6H1_9PEZI|nr:hypothetical protein K402DRAFT_19331 [Aulographum hederae CBS 113979]